ncbi:phage portal protein [Kitasatospora sp. P5_F3]
MPLPTADTPWPPTAAPIAQSLADWDAWFSCSADRLAARYDNRTDRQLPGTFASQYRGGLVGSVARWFWGEPISPNRSESKVHVPIAGDIARVSAGLLFSEPPKLTALNKPTQQRLDELTPQLHPALAESAEEGAALGGTYLRVVWDDSVSDRPWVDSVAADCAAPEFSYGRLRAVTFWQVVGGSGHTVYRHLERHERGVIFHGLYQGTSSSLGQAVPLTESPATAPLAKQVDAQGAIDTGAPDHLTAVYVPNMRPARAWRHVPAARGWGQSDYQGVEPLMDMLDQTYSSWQRDIINGLGRIIAPNSMLQSLGAGQGAAWDSSKSVFTGLDMLPRAGDSNPLTVVQFAIRVKEHSDTSNGLVEQIARQAGYSAATFGATSDGQAVTATEIKARERRSMATRARKALYWGPGLSDIVAALLAVEAGPRFGVDGITVEDPAVEFQDSISDSPREMAETASFLRQAEAASTETLVRMQHPDWDDKQVSKETDAILAESGRAVTDPAALGDEPPVPA